MDLRNNPSIHTFCLCHLFARNILGKDLSLPPYSPNLHASSLRFTQNLSAFRREVNDSMKNSTYGVNSNDMMS